MITTIPFSHDFSWRKLAINSMLSCGILAPLLYIAMNIFIPMQWEEYHSSSQTVSELSAIDAPTRIIWVPFGVLYAVLYSAFGSGVWYTPAGFEEYFIENGTHVGMEAKEKTKEEYEITAKKYGMVYKP